MSLVTVFTFFLFNYLQIARSTTPFLSDNHQFSWGCAADSFFSTHRPPVTNQGYRISLPTFLITTLLGLDLIFHETFFPTLSYLSPSAGPPPAGRQRFMSNLSRRMSSRKDVMSNCSRSLLAKSTLAATALLLLAPFGVVAQSSSGSSKSSSTSSSSDRWLHVRVISLDAKGETVRVNVPLELAEKVLPTINKDRIHEGKVKIDNAHVNDVDLRALVEAIRTAKDGEFVTVQSNDCDVRVAKQNNHLIVHVLDKQNSKRSEVEVKVPMKVIDALFSAGKDELDLVAALHALSSQGDTELVSVKDHENTVRVWLDSKNVTD
jgi:hypothetical protein